MSFISIFFTLNRIMLLLSALMGLDWVLHIYKVRTILIRKSPHLIVLKL
jgi:hypothetical protein